MSRSWYLRIAILTILIIFSCVVLMPTVVEMALYPEVKEDVAGAADDADGEGVRNPPLPEWYTDLPKWMRSKTLSLGLDLQGGLMMRYSVDVDSAIDDKLVAQAAEIRGELAAAGVAVAPKIDRENDQIVFPFMSEGDKDKLSTELLEHYDELTFAHSDGNTVTLAITDTWRKKFQEDSLVSAVETIRQRIDGLGVAQPTVRIEAGKNIAVELPGLSRSRVAQAEKLIAMTAVLTFKLVADRQETIAVFTTLSEKLPADGSIYISGGTLCADDVLEPGSRRIAKSGKDILKAFAIANEGDIPSGREIAFEKVDMRERKNEFKEGEDTSRVATRWRIRLIRTDMPVISGAEVRHAYPASNPDTNLPYVALELNREGGDTFYGITKEHVGDQLAILLDDVLVSDPVIRSEIPGGRVSIEMGRGNRQETLNEVNNLVLSLNSGSLQAPIRQEYKTLVGPSLGADSIQTGMESLLLGFCLVFLFMSIYYRGSGLVASFALMLNVLFIMAGMASMGAALTMPGIAGIVLTVGMSVDANVIVFERIREELRNSETPRKSVHQGYDKALWAILDSNITTAIAAVVLMNFGSGPVKGFAVTLLLGIISTVYTAFFVTRTIFELKVRINPDKLSI